MRTLTLLVIFSISFSSLFAQKALDVKGEKINDSRIYLVLDGETLKYFTHNKTQDGEAILKAEKLFSLKGENNCNIYMKWLNPLKLRVSWKDTIFIDERDKAIDDFITLLTGQFGLSITDLNTQKKDLKSALNNSQQEAGKMLEKNKSKDSDTLKLLDISGFNNLDLTILFIQLNLNIANLEKEEKVKINELIPLLIELDKANSENIKKYINEIFLELLKLDEPDEAKNKSNQVRTCLNL